MLRRDLLRATAAAAALSLLPRDLHAAWARVEAQLQHPTPSVLLARQRAVVGALADAIIPRTETPGALDVGVPVFIDVIVAEYYTDAERTDFTASIEAIEALAVAMTGKPFAALQDAELVAVMDAMDKPVDRAAPAARGYNRIKGLVLHGYFTSERVQREVVKTQIMPGRYDGSAPIPVRVIAPGARD